MCTVRRKLGIRQVGRVAELPTSKLKVCDVHSN